MALIGTALALSFVALRAGLPGDLFTPPLNSGPPALSNHPVYSRYRYGGENKIVDIGTQPLFLPGVISEVMKRDAILKSELAERGLEARFHSFLKGADVNYFLASGDLEAGIGGDMPTLMACANSSVSVASLIDQQFSAIVARQQMMIPELKNQRVGYAYGSNAHHILLEVLAAEGLDSDDIHMVPMDVDRMATALHDGIIDAFSAWEPIVSIATYKYPEFAVIRRVLTTGYLYFSQAFSQSSPEIVRLIVASQLRAMAWIKTSDDNLMEASAWALDAGKKIGGDTDGITARLLSDIVNEGLLGYSASALITEKSLAENNALFPEFRFLQTLGEIPQKMRWNEIRNCFDNTLVPEILSQPERYQLSIEAIIGEFSELNRNE